jgi:hypothetical protein
MIIQVYWFACKVTVFLLRFYVQIFEKKNQNSNVTIIRLVDAEFFHAERCTNDEANDSFSKFCERA